MSKKIVVLKQKQLIYGGIGLVVAVLLLIYFISKLSSGKEDEAVIALNDARYTAGLYTSVIALNDLELHLEVAVDRDCIKSVHISNIDETVTAMYPLVEPSLRSVSEQLCNGISVDSVLLSEDSKYTQSLLLDAIRAVLDKCQISSNSASQAVAQASLGILQSPRGDNATEPTFGPSGRQERLN